MLLLAVAGPALARAVRRRTQSPGAGVCHERAVRRSIHLRPHPLRPADDGGGFRQDIKWAHDYPRGERHFTKIVSELSTIRVRTDVSNIFSLDDPELFKYPVAYLCEAGYWRPSESGSDEPAQLSDEGRVHHLRRLRAQRLDELLGADAARAARSCVPSGSRRTTRSSTRSIASRTCTYNHPYYRDAPSEFWGIFEDNDRDGRLLAMIIRYAARARVAKLLAVDET